ncbi:MAG TPA: hypothetical protein VGC41_05405, partial [Kofleriaceae bacterium]
DRRSDIFALGTVMYELATARRLFKGDNDYATMQMIVEGEVPPPSVIRPGLPKPLDEIIMRALAKDPAARFQTAHDLRSALEAFAMDHELRTTAKAVADYLVSLFGHRPEPWTQGAAAVEADEDTIDFEAAHGTVPTPSNGVQLIEQLRPAADSPITLALEVVRSQTPDPEDDEPDFEEHPTRLDLPPDQEATVLLPNAPILPHESTTSSRPMLEESTTTAAQPIVDVLAITGTNLQPLHQLIEARPQVLNTPPGAPPLHRPGTDDDGDEATTVQPPLFPVSEPVLVHYVPQTHSQELPIPPLTRWGLVAGVLLVPVVFGLLAHACHAR